MKPTLLLNHIINTVDTILTNKCNHIQILEVYSSAKDCSVLFQLKLWRGKITNWK